MLKRAGRGNQASGIDGTKQGELSVLCRSCPHPHINLPLDWKLTNEEKAYVFSLNVISLLTSTSRWLYSLFLAEDANTKQKKRIKANDARDGALGPGWATFVNSDVYNQHIRSCTDEKEVHFLIVTYHGNLNCFIRLTTVWASLHYSICLKRNQRVYPQLASVV